MRLNVIIDLIGLFIGTELAQMAAQTIFTEQHQRFLNSVPVFPGLRHSDQPLYALKGITLPDAIFEGQRTNAVHQRKYRAFFDVDALLFLFDASKQGQRHRKTHNGLRKCDNKMSLAVISLPVPFPSGRAI